MLTITACTTASGTPTPATVPPTSSRTLSPTPTNSRSPTPTGSPSPAPTPRPSPTLTIPENLGRCFETDIPRGVFGCVVHTVAGGQPPTHGDGGPARQAVLNKPCDVELDSDGNLAIADCGNLLVRYIQEDGTITTIAGTGTREASIRRDGAPAVSSSVQPQGLSIGPEGRIYLADYRKVRRFRMGGNIQTVAGTGARAHSGDGGPAFQASITLVTDVAVAPSGEIYIADGEGYRVRKIDPSGVITTVAGNGTPGFSGDGGPGTEAKIERPLSLALWNENKLLITGEKGPVRVLDLTSGVIDSLPGAEGEYVAVGPSGKIYLSSPGRNKVFLYNASSRATVEFAGTGQPGYAGDGGPARSAELHFPMGLAVDEEGNVFIADSYNHRVRKASPEGLISTVAGTGELLSDGAVAAEAVVYDSHGLVTDQHGNIFYSDIQNNLIWRLGIEGRARIVAGSRLGEFSGDGGHPRSAGFNFPRALLMDRAGGLLFLDVSNSSNVVRRIDPGRDGVIDASEDEIIDTVVGIPGGYENSGESSFEVGHPLEANFRAPRGLALNAAGELFIADWEDNRVFKVAPGADGIINGSTDESISLAAGNGEAASNGDDGPAIEAGVNAPRWLGVGPDQSLYIFEAQPSLRIRRVDPDSGVISTIARDLGATSFAIDQEGFIYVPLTSKMARLDPNTGRLQVIAGQDLPGQGGEAVDARLAQFTGASYLAVNSNGDLFVVDNGDYSMRRITFVPLDEQSAPHPVRTSTPVATSALASNSATSPAKYASSTPDERSFMIEFLQRLGMNSHGEIEYEFRVRDVELLRYTPDEWGVQSNCTIVGMGAEQPHVFTISLPSNLPSQTCTLSLTLPTGQSASTIFEHQR